MANDDNGQEGQSGLNSTRRHPPSSYNTQYPFNQKYVSRSGHEVEFDDTPGATRIRIGHGPSGTYTEWSDNGKRVDMTTGKHVVYHKQGVTETSDGNYDEKTGGSHRHSVTGDLHQEVAGDHTQAIGGDHTSITGGDSTHAVNGDYSHGVTGHAMYKFGHGAQIKFDCNQSSGGSSEGSQGDGSNQQSSVTTIIDKDINLQGGTNLTINILDNISITAGQQITLTVGSSTIVITSSSITITSPNVTINGTSNNTDVNGVPVVNINGGGAVMPPMTIPG